MFRKNRLPIGIEDFEEIRTEGYYYVDKTGMIRELLEDGGKVNLFLRPRRFGKTLNMSMLQCFFETGRDRTLFDGLEIMRETELCGEYMGRFPVLSISLKSVSGPDFTTARNRMSTLLGTEACRFGFLADSDKLDERDRERYLRLTAVAREGESIFEMSEEVLLEGLKTLSELLHRHFGEKVILLIDEYDVPLSKANDRGYYDEMAIFIRSFFEQALKTNSHLRFAVLTGCLRISKESIFTGLNNLRVLSVTSAQFNEYFGFTDEEVEAMLEYYGMAEACDTVRAWYDGYQFGNVNVYCPWDVLCYCADHRADPEREPEDYWSNTSSNDVIRRFIDQAGAVTKSEIERLIAGESVTKTVREELTYRDLYTSVDNLWSILFMTGYLTQRGRSEGRRRHLVIPNREIREIFVEQIAEWFDDTVREDGAALGAFCDSFRRGDAETAQAAFNRYLARTISVRDQAVPGTQKENFYHGILLGLLSYRTEWLVLSNRESGEGYSDILVEIRPEDIGIVIEMKYAQDGDLENGCRTALAQIEEKDYEAVLREDGMQTICRFGIACFRKRCRVMCTQHSAADEGR